MFGGIAQQIIQGATAQQNQALQGQQAQARKNQLTGMYLSKGCRMGDIQK